MNEHAATSRLINNVDNHAIQLVNSLSSLFNVNNVNNKFSDVRVIVGNRTFYCHKFVLQIHSEYLANLSFETGTLTLQSINPDQFYDVLQFIYTGEVLVSKDKLESLLSAADILCVKDLRQICVRFLETVNKEHAMNSWKLADKYKESVLAVKFQDEVLRDFKKLTTATSLRSATEEMMMELLRADKLGAKTEAEVCDMLLTWLDAHSQAGHEIHPHKLLPLVRWSAISVDYVNTNLLQASSLSSDSESVAFLRRVLTYLQTGVQFGSLRTFHRPSTGLENCLITFGMCIENDYFREITSISLQRPGVVTKLAELPDSMAMRSKACVLNNSLYITGTGREPWKELWKWNAVSGLEKCPSMENGRRLHCTAVIGNALFVLGGYDGDTSKADLGPVTRVIKYDTETKQWSLAGDLIHAVYSTTCVVYSNLIYVFGGDDKESKAVNDIQVYNPAEKTCTLCDHPLPQPCSGLRAVAWENCALLFGRDTCFIFNLETETWQERHEYKTNVSAFGLALDNATVYVAGGCVNRHSAMNRWDWKNPTDEIKSVSVSDIIEDKLAVWNRHGKLPMSCGLYTFGLVTLPSSRLN